MSDEPIINHYLRQMLELGGSDLHLSINFPAKARIHALEEAKRLNPGKN